MNRCVKYRGDTMREIEDNEIFKIIKDVEDKEANISDKFYYHGSEYDYDKYKKIIEDGIYSPRMLELKDNKKNDNKLYDYIYLSKYSEDIFSAYHQMIIYPNFIIDNKVNAVSNDDSYIKKLLNGGIKNRDTSSLWEGIYQVYKHIPSEHILGVSYSLRELVRMYPDNYYYTNIEILLKILSSLSELLLEYDLPLYDVIAKREINKEKVLKRVR